MMRSGRLPVLRRVVSFLCLPFLAACGQTGLGGATADLAGATADLAGLDLAGAGPDLRVDAAAVDLGGLGCRGGETFQEARAAMLSTCGGFPQCHLTARLGGFAGGLDLRPDSAYAQLVNVAAAIAPGKLRVRPGDPARSFLVEKLINAQGPDEGSPMPRTEGLPWHPPDPAKLRQLQCWIAAGARDD